MSRGDSGLVGMPEHGSIAAVLADYERRLQALESSNRLTSASIGSGGLTLKNGGTIQLVNDSGDVVAELDKDSQTFFDGAGNPLTVLDGNGLDIGSGLVVVDADGLQVGSDVVIDSAGLKIDGIIQPALANLTDSDSDNPTLTTSFATIGEVTLNIPSWADEVTLVTFARLQFQNTDGAVVVVRNRLVNDVGGLDQSTDDAVTVENTNRIGSSFVALTTTVTNPGSTITCRQRGRMDTSVSHNAESRIEVIAIVRRTS